MAPTTPDGLVHDERVAELLFPIEVSAALAASAKAPAGRPTWTEPDRVMGMPTSWLITSASSSVRAASASPMRLSSLPRSSREVAAQAGRPRPRPTARSTSSGVPSGMVANTSSVAESITSRVPVPVEGTQAPSM